MTIKAKKIDGTEHSFELTSHPDICPICHHHNIPKLLYSAVIQINKPCVLYQCTNHKCNEVFLAYYFKQSSTQPSFTIQRLEPYSIIEEVFNDSIKSISPEFVKIYNQAIVAEKKGLDQISGVGFRKSLEFLIKDYLISLTPDAKEEIEKEFLGKSIKDRVTDSKIKACVERAVWIGNDETHYTRKWSDKDISDMKVLIKLATIWIESEILTKKYIEEMETN